MALRNVHLAVGLEGTMKSGKGSFARIHQVTQCRSNQLGCGQKHFHVDCSLSDPI